MGAKRHERTDSAIDSSRHDLDALAEGLRATAADWVPKLFPRGRRDGNEWRLANISGDPPRKSGSCVIQLNGKFAGSWVDFASDDRGGPLSTLKHATGLEGRALFERAESMIGHAALPSPSSSGADDAAKTREWIATCLADCLPLSGSVAETYLRNRGIEVAVPHDLLFHPALTCWEVGSCYPALIAVVRGLDGDVRAIHRTYLSEDGDGKADVPKPRMMRGPVSGGAVRLADIGPEGVLGLAEGLETALSAMQACTDLPVWAVLSAGNFSKVELPVEARRIVILADNDESSTGLKAAEQAAARLHRQGRQVSIAVPPVEGDDFNDLLQRDGADAVRSAVAAAREWVPKAGADSREGFTAAAVGHLPVGFDLPLEARPQLRADEGDLARLTDRCWSLLKASNSPCWLYRAAGKIRWVERDDDGRPVVRPVTVERLRHVLALLADWHRTSKSGDLVPAPPPRTLLENLLATPDPDLPVLSAIVTAPVFGADGSLVTKRGYHPATRLLYEPDDDFELPDVPLQPSTSDIEEARSLLLDDLLGDFPFTGAAERAHALALLLLPFVRPMIKSPTPLHLIEKPAPGTGATLMVDAISIVATGASAMVMVEGRDDEEWRKRLTAKLSQIPSVILIDNLRRKLDASSVAAALTAPVWEDRILGTSETGRFPIRCTWIATGNNPQFSNEIARRLVRIRLDARVDQPWRRHGFRHSNLLKWVGANRARLVAACLTLGRAWITAGCPHHATTLGSFESWAETMGGILGVAGVPGFLANLDDMYEAADAEGAVWRAFVASWWERYGAVDVGTADLFELALQIEPPLPLGDGNERSQRTRLGKLLGQMRDRVFQLDQGAVRLVAGGVRHKAQRWLLESVERGGRSSVAMQCSHPRSPENSERDQDVGEHWERGEHLPAPYAYAPARAYVREEGAGKRSQCSPRSLSPAESTTCEWEREGERRSGCSHDEPPLNGECSFDAIFEMHGLDPMNDDDRATAAGIWMNHTDRRQGDASS